METIILNELNKINNEISLIKDKMSELFMLMLETRKTQLKQYGEKDPGLLEKDPRLSGCNIAKKYDFPDDELLDKLEKQELQNAISEQIADEKSIIVYILKHNKGKIKWKH